MTTSPSASLLERIESGRFEHAIFTGFIDGLLIRASDLNDRVAQFGAICKRTKCLTNQRPSRLADLGLRRVDTSRLTLRLAELIVRIYGFN